MVRFLLQTLVLVSVLWTSTNAIFGFNKGRSTIFREPPFADYSKTSRFVTLEHIDQMVDNFDPNNNATYKMRYYRNDEFFIPGSPIIIYVGGEWTIYQGSLLSGRIYELAEELHAQLYYTEHRYYGQSHPTPNASVANLKYLSVEQALADLANFIVEVKKEPGKEDSKVVIVGGSYSATMVTWFKQKYPNLAAGAWASSAPVFAKTNFIEYKQVVGAAIRHVGGEQCYRLIGRIFQQAESLIHQRNYTEFTRSLQLCPHFDGDNILNVWSAFGSLANMWSGTVQYQTDGMIEGSCNELIELAAQPNTTEIEAYGQWIHGVTSRDHDHEHCTDFTYESDIEWYENEDWDEDDNYFGAREWLYQTCTEFGWYQTSDSIFHPFGSNFPIDLYYQYCEDIFGLNRSTVIESVRRTNERFGGREPNVENVFFTNGQVDPWRTMGIQVSENDSSPATVIRDASHCQDLRASTEKDNDEMRAAKIKIRDLIKKWTNYVEPIVPDQQFY